MIFIFYQIVAFFFIYAFLGWCAEVAFQGVTNGKLVNRGFLNGPVCPIYGVGMVGVLLILTPLADNLFILFVGGIIITTIIELFGGWALDKLFHMRWWDYSDKPFNFKGYICLEFCLIWGIGVTCVVRMIHPMIESIVKKVPYPLGVVFLVIFSISMLVDIIVTYKTVIGITRNLGEMERIAETLHDISENLTKKVGTTAIVATEKAEASKEKMTDAVVDGREKIAESKERMTEAVTARREKMSDTFETGKYMITDTIGAGKDKITDTIGAGKDKITDTIGAGKDKITDTIGAGKDKIADTIGAGKDKIADTIGAGRDKLSESKEKLTESKEKFTETIETAKLENERKKAESAAKRAELEAKRADMEKKYTVLMEKLQKQTKRFAKAFPEWHVSDQKKSIAEYIKNLKK